MLVVMFRHAFAIIGGRPTREMKLASAYGEGSASVYRTAGRMSVMAELKTKTRKKLPDSKFAGKDRTYPIPDKKHAANAKARATQQAKKGNLLSSEAASIKRKANKVLRKSS